MIPFSVLDLSPIVQDSHAGEALGHTLDLARHAERLGYHRFWLAEHHNMPGIASAATAVVIGHVAAGTERIRVGSGGVMLPNHAPLVIAEQFGTLAALFPDRIDLGLGRAPGTDTATARALRRYFDGVDRFADDVAELQHYFCEPEPGQTVRAVPGAGLRVPLWLLGSSLFSAELAARMGLPFAFASHFAPDYLHNALELYRSRFRPSEQLQQPYAMVAANLVAADSDEEARRLFTSIQLQFLRLRRGTPGQLPPPVDDMSAHWNETEEAMVRRTLRCSAVGGPETVRTQLAALIAETGADELILTSHLFDHAARLRSYAIGAEARAQMANAA
ncbi:LLM class flavin-dependent oxidoreductase [Niveibacterium sp. SC-1]|uniref:LLM class flavin-dependent oxidoreductase n=1 Tax=Niveibacterium sp. SC-1 TaxID=3135646 RepID=UPI003120113A